MPKACIGAYLGLYIGLYLFFVWPVNTIPPLLKVNPENSWINTKNATVTNETAAVVEVKKMQWHSNGLCSMCKAQGPTAHELEGPT